jgi:hypothetical protein
MANFIMTWRTKSKLKKTLKNRHQEIRRNLGVFDSDFNSPELREGAFSIFGLMLSFGSKEKSREYLNAFVDVNAIEESKDTELIGLLNKSIKLASNFSKLWIVMMVSIALAAMLWPKG